MTVNTPWALILCSFNDVPEINQPRKHFEDFLTKAVTGGLYQYWKDISSGAISLDGSKIIDANTTEDPNRIGWFTMQYSFVKDGDKPRDTWINEAKRLAGDKLSGFKHIMVVVNALVDAGRSGVDFVLTIGGPWGEYNWRWCKNCHCISHSPDGKHSAGICAQDLTMPKPHEFSSEIYTGER